MESITTIDEYRKMSNRIVDADTIEFSTVDE